MLTRFACASIHVCILVGVCMGACIQMWFIDKLNVHQDHNFSLPIVGAEMCLKYDLQTGETVSESPTNLKEEGSYSTNLIIRCNGTRVSVQGNPSRFNRIDNLFGFTTFEQCVAVYNRVLADLGLPPFTKCTRYEMRQDIRDDADNRRAQLWTDGAVFDHLDWTRNHAVGKGNEYQFLRGISSQTMGRGRVGHLFPNGATCAWGYGSTYGMTKLYIKSVDLRDHFKSNTKNQSLEDITYYNSVINYCDDVGIVREEQSFKRPLLRRKNLSFYGLTKESDFAPLLDIVDVTMKRLEINAVHTCSIAQQLVNSGVCSSTKSANATQMAAMIWLAGDNVELAFSRSQYFKHKSNLKQIGIDISVPYDVCRLSPVIRRVEAITVKPVEIPTWYRRPSILRAA